MFILSQAKNEEHTHTLTLCPSLQHFLLYLAPTFSCSSPFHSTLTHLEYIDLLLSPSSFSLPLLIPPPLLCLILHFFIIALPPSQQLSRLLYIRISFVSCLPGSHEWYSLIHITHTKAYTHTPRTHNESHARTHAKYTAHVHGYTPRTSRHRGEENQIFKSDD